ncbi:MacS family sensor histidine kinase [Arsenicicoccus sp. oral taxon 190]|uniref:MacS family sensor histidine kinase n=1 Tax=Arsenicicoccus sp. oral taxon 190 TaxID=1658671 RepID=UPI00067A0587|nr:DUF5931 domain-containing protein [Arsenicicoccus sp. oral taxon 190]AKT52043.1 hypothetical protein ADJ73_13530 [Arsenicicoccus sp. oral taxon 190]
MPGATSVSGIELGLWRAVEVFRVLALVYAAVMVWLHQGGMTRPWLAWLTLLALAAWAVAAVARRARSVRVVVVEVGLVCAAILITRLVHPAGDIEAGATTIPAMYAAAPVAAAAVVRGLRGGVLAAAAVTVANLVEVVRPTGATIYNSLLLVLAAACLGICTDLGRRSQAALAEAMRVRARAAERERLARVVHDGVLQTLSYIHRRGAQLGGEAAELGGLAAESERALRRLVTTLPQLEPGAGAAPGATQGARVGLDLDLRPALASLAGPGVEVALPASGVVVPEARGRELVAAVRACLDNVRLHAGPSARAWVLLEDLGGRVEVTVRDDGCGIAPGRLQEAAAQGRLGVASSVRGRIADLGGAVTYRGGPGRGTTWWAPPPTAPVRCGGAWPPGPTCWCWTSRCPA